LAKAKGKENKPINMDEINKYEALTFLFCMLVIFKNLTVLFDVFTMGTFHFSDVPFSFNCHKKTHSGIPRFLIKLIKTHQQFGGKGML